MNSRPTAVVLAAGLNGLCTVRSLGRRGLRVIAVVSDRRQIAAYSRYAVPFVREAHEEVGACLGRLKETFAVERAVCIATSDRSAYDLASVGENMPGEFTFAGPSQDIVAMLQDKRSEIETLARITDCLPASCATLPDSPEQLAEQLGWPVILKPRTQAHADAVRFKNRVLHNIEGLREFYRAQEERLDWFVAQEVIAGNDESIWQCNAVFDRSSRLVSAFTFQKLGMSPPHYGVTTMGRSQTNPALVTLVAEIGDALRYVGPAGFEFKYAPKQGGYRYIEINPRFGMSNSFDTTCGVNTAYHTYLLGCGESESGPPKQEDGVVFLDLYADLYSRLLDDREALGAVVTRYRSLIGARRAAAYWAWDDPRPAIALIPSRLRELTGSVSRFARRRWSS